MLEKILDKYYAMKLIEEMQHIKMKWFLDFKFTIKKDKVIVSAKKNKYEDIWYRDIMTIKSADYLYYLCNYNALRETMKKDINIFFEFEGRE